MRVKLTTKLKVILGLKVDSTRYYMTKRVG